MSKSQASIGSNAAKLENRQIYQTGNTIKMPLALSQPKAVQGTLPCTSLLIVLKQVCPGTLPFLEGKGPSLQFSGGCHRYKDRQCCLKVVRLSVLPSLLLANPGNFRKAFVQRITTYMSCSVCFQRGDTAPYGDLLQKWKSMFNPSLSRTP